MPTSGSVREMPEVVCIKRPWLPYVPSVDPSCFPGPVRTKCDVGSSTTGRAGQSCLIRFWGRKEVSGNMFLSPQDQLAEKICLGDGAQGREPSSASVYPAAKGGGAP